MTGISLAACAGLRAWLPLLVVGILGKTGVLPLGQSFGLLARTEMLVILGVATVLELLGDKIALVDHFLDAVGTVARPAAGTVLAASVLTQLDPTVALVLGLIVGGGTAFTIHSGKAALRATGTGTAPGVSNAALSLGEDVLSGGLLWLTMAAPIVAFLLALAGVALAVWAVIAFVRTGRRLIAVVGKRRRPS